MANSLPVGLGEIKVSRDAQDVLVAYGLGSCLGIGLHDPVNRVSGLLHAILPQCPHPGARSDQAGKYVDSGVEELIRQVVSAGADRRRLLVRMAGGANMLTAPSFSQVLSIGARNVEAAQAILNAQNLRPLSQDVGGNIGRTVCFYVADGRMTIRTAGKGEREI